MPETAMKNRDVITTLVLTLLFLTTTQAQYTTPEEFKRLGQSSMTFLDIDVGARMVSLGGTYTCIDQDANAVFGNPAGIAKLKGGAVSLSNTQWIADINLYALAATFGAQKLGTFGLSFVMLDNGEIERTIPSKDIELYPEGYFIDGSYNVNQWVAGLAYGRQVTDKFS